VVWKGGGGLVAGVGVGVWLSANRWVAMGGGVGGDLCVTYILTRAGATSWSGCGVWSVEGGVVAGKWRGVSVHRCQNGGGSGGRKRLLRRSR